MANFLQLMKAPYFGSVYINFVPSQAINKKFSDRVKVTGHKTFVRFDQNIFATQPSWHISMILEMSTNCLLPTV